MRGLNSESVDPIYLDPPFNSKKNYAEPIDSKTGLMLRSRTFGRSTTWTACGRRCCETATPWCTTPLRSHGWRTSA